jgi:hypothetical protein
MGRPLKIGVVNEAKDKATAQAAGLLDPVTGNVPARGKDFGADLDEESKKREAARVLGKERR